MSVAGLIGWASTTCPILHFMVGSLRRVANHRVADPAVRSLLLNPECVAAIVTLDGYLRGWSRSERIFLGFTPVSTWDVLVRSDASTAFGAYRRALGSSTCGYHRNDY